MKRFILIFFLFALRAEAGMVRVIGIDNASTLIVGGNGSQAYIRLAGVTITDETSAKEHLRRTIVGRWVLVTRVGAEAFVHRSPDALFINRELVVRGYARATIASVAEPEPSVPMIMLGEFDPVGPQRERVNDDSRRTSNGTYRRSPDPPRPRASRPRSGRRGRN